MWNFENSTSYDQEKSISNKTIVSTELLKLMWIPEDSDIVKECNNIHENTKTEICNLLNDSLEASDNNLDHNSNSIKLLWILSHLDWQNILLK